MVVVIEVAVSVAELEFGALMGPSNDLKGDMVLLDNIDDCLCVCGSP